MIYTTTKLLRLRITRTCRYFLIKCLRHTNYSQKPSEWVFFFFNTYWRAYLLYSTFKNITRTSYGVFAWKKVQNRSQSANIFSRSIVTNCVYIHAGSLRKVFRRSWHLWHVHDVTFKIGFLDGYRFSVNFSLDGVFFYASTYVDSNRLNYKPSGKNTKNEHVI